jgi:lysophospholipase L1-like esterase
MTHICISVLGSILALASSAPIAPEAQPACRVKVVGTWAAAQQAPNAVSFFGTNWSMEGFANHSLRQVVRISTGGSKVRIRLSNAYGTRPLPIAGASIARAGAGAAIQPGTSRRLTFDDGPAVTIAPGRETVSDAIDLPVAPLERVAVTLYFDEPSGPATFHLLSSSTSYRASGDHLEDEAPTAFTETSLMWYLLSGVEVTGRSSRVPQAVVTFGDSITDGAFSTLDQDRRYPDVLAERLRAAGKPLAVVNTGLSGNRLLTDTACFGERALARFERDVARRPGARSVVVLLGINDILAASLGDDPGFAECAAENPIVTAEQLIEGHRVLIRSAHARGLRAIGGTLTPYRGDLWTEAGEQIRSAVNTWIRTSGEYDAVADFDSAVADPTDPTRIRPDFDGGDGLHPNDAGLRAMAEAIDLEAL